MKRGEGWVMPWNGRKFHYQAADGRTLCGMYGMFPDELLQADTGKPSKDDCRACRRKLDARQKASS